MINVIKTAIITIIISFISGLLLDYYKNLAPRILCSIGKGTPVEMNNKKIYAYIVAISNLSRKTIHELALNIQSSRNNLNITDAKITRGLKFDSSIKNNILDVSIPFLSKGDKFSVTVYVESQYAAVNSKPAVVIRSPENFKEIYSAEQGGILASLSSIPKNINRAISKIMKKPASVADETPDRENKEVFHGNRKTRPIKKAMIITVSVILVVLVGILGMSYLRGTSSNTTDPTVKTNVHKQSTDSTGTSGQTTGNTDSSTSGTSGNKDSNSSTSGTSENSGSNSSTGESTGNTGSNSSTSGTSGNSGSDSSTSGSSGNTGSTSPTGSSAGNTNSKTSTSGSSGNTGSTSSTGSSSGNTGSTSPSGAQSGGNTGN